MKALRTHWYWIVLLAIALLVGEPLVQWALAVRVGGYGIRAGFADAFEDLTLVGYLFTTAFRLIPYVCLGLALRVIASSRKRRNCFLPVFIGGLAGVLAMILWGSWTTQRPYYTSEHVSSTTAIDFIFIPFYACFTGALGATAAVALYLPIRCLVRRPNSRAA